MKNTGGRWILELQEESVYSSHGQVQTDRSELWFVPLVTDRDVWGPVFRMSSFKDSNLLPQPNPQ